jgi:hypothetical protein
MLGVVFGAQPADIKRTRIIVVVRLNLGTTAHFARLLEDFPVAHGVV